MTQIDKTNGVNKPTTNQNGIASQNVKRDTTAANSIFNNTKIIVQNGETPESLGKMFGVKSQDIINQNKDKWNGKWFKVGQEISLPTQIDSNDERLKNRAQNKKEAEKEWLDYKSGNEKSKSVEQKPQQAIQTPKPAFENTALGAGASVGAAIGKALNNPSLKDSAQAAKSDTTKVQTAQIDNKTPEPKQNSDMSGLSSGAKVGLLIGQAAENLAKADTTKVLPKMTPAEPAKPSLTVKKPEIPTEGIKLASTQNAPSKDALSEAKQTELKNRHGGIDTKRTNRNKKAEGDIVYHKDGSVTISDRVDKRIKEMAQNLKCSPDDLKGLLFKESRFEINGKGSAAGLNQMTRDGLAGLNRKYGTNFSKKDIRRMDVMQQLDIAEASLMLSKEEKFGADKQVNAGQLFALNLYPSRAKKNDVITSAHGAAYSNNKGLDKNRDGIISINELQREILNNAKHVHTDLT